MAGHVTEGTGFRPQMDTNRRAWNRSEESNCREFGGDSFQVDV